MGSSWKDLANKLKFGTLVCIYKKTAIYNLSSLNFLAQTADKQIPNHKNLRLASLQKLLYPSFFNGIQYTGRPKSSVRTK